MKYTSGDIITLIVLLLLMASVIILLINWAKNNWTKVKRYWKPSKKDE